MPTRQAGILPKNSIICLRRSCRVSGDDDVARIIHTVHLEYVLGEINADGANLHVDDPLR